MSDEPSFDFLAWEELPVGVRRNRKKMYNYLVSVLGGDEPGPTPPGPTPTGTGTVTVTTVDSESNPLEQTFVLLLTEDAQPSPQNIVGEGITGAGGVTLIYEVDAGTGEPTTVVKQVEYGNYYLYANYDGETTLTYSGALTVDGDETVTITLTEE